jgi:UDP-N-acetylmuramyl pentapeptide phosphotransferase/UDP-N-acetylglucosamine-1-phosphate transferase/glycosyltransferase involved in cell wall biosynthesis
MTLAFVTLFGSFVLGLLLTPVGGFVARRLGILRCPEGWPASGPPTVPVVGGPVILAVIFLVAVLTAALEVVPWSIWHGNRTLLGELGAVAIVCVVGVLDDWRGLRGRWKLLGQCVAALAAVAAGVSVDSIQLFDWQIGFGPLRWFITIAVLLVATNSLVVLKGMDGLVSSYGMIVAAALGTIGFMNDDLAPAVLALAMAGGLFAFLIKSFPPAAVFMGSSGATTVGFLIGIVAIVGSSKTQAAAMLAVPAALLTLPLFDGAATVFRRSLSRHGLYAPDQGQLYHRLLRIGFSRRRILAVICTAALVTAVGAVLSQFYKREFFAVMAAATIVAVLLATRLFGNVRLSWHGHKPRAARLLAAPAAADLPVADEIDWSSMWAGVVTAAPSLNLRHVLLEVASDDTGVPPRSHNWDDPAPSPKGEEHWRAEFSLSSRGRPIGRLELVGVRGDEPDVATLGRLAEQVPEFRRIAAVRPAGWRRGAEDSSDASAHRCRVQLLEAVSDDDVMRSYRAGVVRLRVCHLGKFYPPAPGGIENHVRTLAAAQARLGARVRVICVNHQSTAGHDSTWKGLGATPTVEERDGPVWVTRVGKVATAARFDICPELVKVLRRLVSNPPHIVHLHTPNPTMLLAYSLACPTLPLVVTHHSDVVRQRLLRYALGPFRRIVYTRAQRILTTSPDYVGGSLELKSYLTRVADLPLGIDLAPFLNPSAAAIDHARILQARYPGPLWLGVGRLTYYKAFDLALEALVHVPGTLMIIGSGPLDAALRRKAVELGVADRVVWQGYATPDELVGAYHAATALWFPSNARSEAFGLVQVEAMASGCPVINTAIPFSGVTYVSPNDVTGLTVPVNDAVAFAAAARRLLDEAGLRGRLGRAGRQRATAEFDHLVMARRSLEIYANVLTHGPVGEREASLARIARVG